MESYLMFLILIMLEQYFIQMLINKYLKIQK